MRVGDAVGKHAAATRGRPRRWHAGLLHHGKALRQEVEAGERVVGEHRLLLLIARQFDDDGHGTGADQITMDRLGAVLVDAMLRHLIGCHGDRATRRHACPHEVEASALGLLDIAQFRSASVQQELVAIARERYAPDRDVHALTEAMGRLTSLEYWPGQFDGSMASLVELKTFTSYLIGRFCVSAQIATQIEYGSEPLTRYAASLVVPDEVRDEVSVMKAVAVKYVMNRPGADAEYARQREVIAELVHGLTLDEGRSLEPWLKPTFDAATTDAQRFRVIIDQVASLTDVSVIDWHRRIVR